MRRSRDCQRTGRGARPKVTTDPQQPSIEEVSAHEFTHMPYRSWCKVCVMSRGREDAHPRSKKGRTKQGLLEVGLDYNTFGEEEDKVASIVMKDANTGVVFANVIECKGPEDVWTIKKLVNNLDTLGRQNVILKLDGEPALVAVQTKVIRWREGNTVPENQPAYNPESNGAIEKGVQGVNALARCIKLGLEAKIWKEATP